MARPDDRPLRRLPQLEARKATLERCVFCPKLCRVACPVSNEEPRETLTPWGKMSMAYFVANESAPLSASFADPAWACTGCFGCRERCDHKNDVTGTLFDARSALVSAGQAPPAARRVLDRFEERAKVLGSEPGPRDPSAKVAVLVGCEHARQKSEAGAATLRAALALTGESVSLVDVCCGAPLLHAGDGERFAEQGRKFARAIEGKSRVVVTDAGCAATLRVHHPAHGTTMPAPVQHLVELAAASLAFDPLDETGLQRAGIKTGGEGPIRWHDPCQLGRGLGIYEAPRAILARALGRPADEFERRREHGGCSGAGGLLPVTMPAVARGIADGRTREHERLGGGTVVTACASSARSLRRSLTETGGPGAACVVDIASVIAAALRQGKG